MVVLIVVVAASVLLSGGVNTSGQFVCTIGQDCKGNTDVEAQFQADVGTPATVVRSLNTTSVSAGQYVKVSLTVAVGVADTYTIQESVPPGWTLISPGTMQASTDNSYLTVIQQSAAVDTVHSYIVQAPANPTQFYPVSGIFAYGKTFVQKYNQAFLVTGKIISGTQTISLASSIQVTAPRGIILNGTSIGTGSALLNLDPKTYTLSFEDQAGFLKPSTKTITITAGKKTTVSCVYMSKDIADIDSNADVSTAEIGSAMVWYRTTQKDPSGNTYDLTKFLNTLDRFYQGLHGGYYPEENQCTITTS